MIDFLSNWIQKIAMAVIIVSIFELILPNGNLKKYIKVVLGIYIVFCIISPFINNSIWKNLADINLEEYITNMTDTQEVSSNFSMEDLYIDELKNNIKKQVESKGYKVGNCKIIANLSKSSKNPGIHEIKLSISKLEKDNKININLPKIGEKEDIEKETEITREEIEDLKETLSNYYEINKDIIEIE